MQCQETAGHLPGDTVLGDRDVSDDTNYNISDVTNSKSHWYVFTFVLPQRASTVRPVLNASIIKVPRLVNN